MRTKPNAKASDYPEWFTAVAQPILAQITGRFSGKRRATILAISVYRVLGISVDWTRRDIYGRTRWWEIRDDYKHIQTAVDEALIEAKDSAAVSAVDDALTELQLNAHELVEKLLRLTNSPDEQVALRAINSALDRASKRTAPKAADSIKIEGLDDVLGKVYGNNQSDGA